MTRRPPAVPQHLVERMRAADRAALGLTTRAELLAAADQRTERQEMDLFCGWLTQRGYWPRVEERLVDKDTGAVLPMGKPARGWWVHLNEAKRNPILLDVLVLAYAGWYLEIEFKTAAGKLRPVQAAILAAGGAVVLVRSAEEAIEAVRQREDAETEFARLRARVTPTCRDCGADGPLVGGVLCAGCSDSKKGGAACKR
jgi:hypothetical protein